MNNGVLNNTRSKWNFISFSNAQLDAKLFTEFLQPLSVISINPFLKLFYVQTFLFVWIVFEIVKYINILLDQF